MHISPGRERSDTPASLQFPIFVFASSIIWACLCDAVSFSACIVLYAHICMCVHLSASSPSTQQQSPWIYLFWRRYCLWHILNSQVEMKFFSPTPRNSFPAAERSGARAFLFPSSRVPIQKSGWRRGLPQIPLWTRAFTETHTASSRAHLSRLLARTRVQKESAKLLWMSRESEWVSCAKKGCVNCTFGISQAAGGKSPEPRCVLHSEFCLLFQARSVWRQGLQTPSSRLGNNQLSLIIVSWFWHNLGIHCQLKLNLRKKIPLDWPPSLKHF